MSSAKIFIFTTLLLALNGLASISAQSGEQYYSEADFFRVDKIDSHLHLHSTGPDFMVEAQHDHFQVLTINVDYADFPPLEKQAQIARQLRQNYPGQVAYATTFSVQDYDQPGWADAVIKQIDDAVSHGAVAVKVWKNIGMALRSADGKMVMIDDPHFKPIFDHLEQAGIVLLGHQGEPKNCWLPMAEMSVKNDQEYFTTHPQYYMYLHPELPSYEDQIRARDHMLSMHPKLRFVGLHLASLEWSVSALADFLDRYPDAMVDMAARIGQLQAQSLQHREQVRNFMIRYQDRLMYGTDLDQEPAEAQESCKEGCGNEPPFPEQARIVWQRDWRYLTSDDVLTVPELDQPVRGLKLPKQVVDKIISLNARREFPTAWVTVGPGKKRQGQVGYSK